VGGGLTPAKEIAARVLEHEPGAFGDVSDAVSGLVETLGTLGWAVTAVRRAASPDELRGIVAELRGNGATGPAADVSRLLRGLPTAEAVRRGSPLWGTLRAVDEVEPRLVPRCATRLLPFVFRYADAEAWAAASPGPVPAADEAPDGTSRPAAALRVLRDARRRHARIRQRALRRLDLVAGLASAAPHVAAYSVVGARSGCTLVVLGRPAVSLEEGVLHAWRQPAVRWADGTGRWFWRGVALPASITRRLPALTGKSIVSIRNVELRRLAVEYLGVEGFLRACGATRVAQDDFGTLWRTRIAVDDEPFVAVEVVNATAEPDGSYRRYFLRVPPETRTAREGVAWTFGFDSAEEYIVTTQT